MPETEDDEIPVGECPVHGYVYGEDVDVSFPNRAECDCGETLERVTWAERSMVESIVDKE